MSSKFSIARATVYAAIIPFANGFVATPSSTTTFCRIPHRTVPSTRYINTILKSSEGSEESSEVLALTTEQTNEAVGNLVKDDEWGGLTMELSELVRVAIIEDVKSNARDFLGKDEYKMGDVSKEIDRRIKDEVANLRNKDEYELGDLTAAIDTIAKEMTCELTGKEDYEFGDLSTEVDTRIKSAVADFCGKDTYQFGDLTTEIDRRAKEAVAEFTSRENYEFGDISREIETRRKEWMKDVLGEEAAASYEFGDLTKNALSKFTGKDEYEFGDVSKKLLGNLFGKRKRFGGE